MISSKGRSVIAFVAAFGLVFAFGSIAMAAEHGVGIEGFAYAPSPLTIHVGDTVTWKNGDPVSHTATADDGSCDAGTIASGSLASQTFDTAGTFAYHCTIHSSMHGTLVVEAAAASQPAAGGPPPTDASPPPAADAGPSPFVGLLLAAAAALGLELGRRRFRAVR
jgi:plastocyanin